jgi:hypothetical protein
MARLVCGPSGNRRLVARELVARELALVIKDRLSQCNRFAARFRGCTLYLSPVRLWFRFSIGSANCLSAMQKLLASLAATIRRRRVTFRMNLSLG